MSNVNLTINGCAVQAKAGSTVLQAARQAGIDIPTLCHHPALADIGACRMCLVEVGKLPALQPACTYPVAEGLEIQTETDRVNKMRRFVLEMLFSERNHYCMYCEMSGDCELQALAYKYGLDHWTYPSPNNKFEVDGSRPQFIMDHNRCILCRRCVRACADLAANHTLGMRMRGAKTMVSADMDVPFGDSTCVACGTCLQVCPTGALVDRLSAYKGRNAQVERTASACTACGVGCRTQVVTRAGKPLRVEGDWNGANGGVLCKRGRFDPLYENKPRVSAPMIRKEGALVQAGWDEALAAIAARIKAAGGRGVRAWAAGGALGEAIAALAATFREKAGGVVGVLEPLPPAAALLGKGGELADLDTADCVVVAGADPIAAAPVLGYRVKRAFFRKARVIVVADGPTGLDEFCTDKLPPARLAEVASAAGAAARPVVIYGAELGVDQAQALAPLRGTARFLAVAPTAASLEAQALGLDCGGINGARPAVSFVLAGDTELDAAVLEKLRASEFLAVMTATHGELTAAADVVLPAPLWFERQGGFTNLEGRRLTVNRAVAPPEGILGEAEALERLAMRL